jgi:hypothetical protein
MKCKKCGGAMDENDHVDGYEFDYFVCPHCGKQITAIENMLDDPWFTEYSISRILFYLLIILCIFIGIPGLILLIVFIANNH